MYVEQCVQHRIYYDTHKCSTTSRVFHVLLQAQGKSGNLFCGLLLYLLKEYFIAIPTNKAKSGTHRYELCKKGEQHSERLMAITLRKLKQRILCEYILRRTGD